MPAFQTVVCGPRYIYQRNVAKVCRSILILYVQRHCNVQH